ncbi:3-isopropylmalate/(R)-2-methylmalate dehydratase large subunit [Polaromonas sp. OV174]|uniref:3-isopropylmalate dehydratase large subunit n=1 Tax=Polaromonas sp. OV174 TaxID=1855300 RepID=UPI0008EB62D0|nr:3-isopropylmalate dehydratase large subunit [Polaromonas sp. OV174]SFC03099.1 3-isopropylmalate/(R)-2-methylmalate dehydratase large subunit [Polaromonas sp. OV174]
MTKRPPQSLFEKIWSRRRIADLDADGSLALVHIDRVMLHERTGGVALRSLSERKLPVRRPSQVFATIDHIVDTRPGRTDITLMPSGTNFIRATREEAHKAGIHLFDIDDPRQGIVHVISPEQGIVLPGITLVCPDSHTCTQGAFGALAWGIGSSEAEHALATQTLRVRKPRSMRVLFNGRLAAGVSAKDMALALIARYGSDGAQRCVVEFDGPAVRELSIEARQTLCNMAVEFSAFTALIAPDEQVFDALYGRSFAPKDSQWDQAVAFWRTLRSDDDADFDAELQMNASALSPMVTWGTSPQHACGVDEFVPDPEAAVEARSAESAFRALAYMGLKPGDRLADLPIQAAFIGSCTNSRLSDLVTAAAILRGRRVAPNVRAICVPGSTSVKREAEALGLHRVFIDAGFEWREAGCSMCFFAGGESFGESERVISTTNRNFEGRQGPQTRTHLASPATVAASALVGRIADPRVFFEKTQ